MRAAALAVGLAIGAAASQAPSPGLWQCAGRGVAVVLGIIAVTFGIALGLAWIIRCADRRDR